MSEKIKNPNSLERQIVSGLMDQITTQAQEGLHPKLLDLALQTRQRAEDQYTGPGREKYLKAYDEVIKKLEDKPDLDISGLFKLFGK